MAINRKSFVGALAVLVLMLMALAALNTFMLHQDVSKLDDCVWQIRSSDGGIRSEASFWHAAWYYRKDVSPDGWIMEDIVYQGDFFYQTMGFGKKPKRFLRDSAGPTWDISNCASYDYVDCLGKKIAAKIPTDVDTALDYGSYRVSHPPVCNPTTGEKRYPDVTTKSASLF